MSQESSAVSHQAPQRFDFSHFARRPEYEQVNDELLAKLVPYLPNPFVHVDVGTGTGLIPQKLIQLAEKCGLGGLIIGIDPNLDSLTYARQDTPPSDAITVAYIRGYGQDTQQLVAGQIPLEGVDSASIHDAIHEIRGVGEKRRVLQAIAAIVRPGGMFSLNSAFTTRGDESAPLDWGRLKSAAFKRLGGIRDRSVTALERHRPEEYLQMVQDQGLEILYSGFPEVFLTKDTLRAIAHYPTFIEGVFRDMVDQHQFPLEQKWGALVQALDSLKGEGLPRVWFELIAQKPVTVS